MIPNKMNYYPLTEKRAEILDLKNFKTKLLTVHLISPEPWKVLCFHFQYRYIVEQQYFPWNVFGSRQGYAV